jgi:hypothetical protein
VPPLLRRRPQQHRRRRQPRRRAPEAPAVDGRGVAVVLPLDRLPGGVRAAGEDRLVARAAQLEQQLAVLGVGEQLALMPAEV